VLTLGCQYERSDKRRGILLDEELDPFPQTLNIILFQDLSHKLLSVLCQTTQRKTTLHQSHAPPKHLHRHHCPPKNSLFCKNIGQDFVKQEKLVNSEAPTEFKCSG
jgi:hypothetical protein